MNEARRQYFKGIFFSPLNKDIPWTEQKELRNDLTAVLDEFDQEASLEDIHAIFSIPENTYDTETLKKAVEQTTFPGNVLLALYGTLSGLGVEETNIQKLHLRDFWGYVGKFAGSNGVHFAAPLPRSIGKINNIEEVDFCVMHDGLWGVTRFPRELCLLENLTSIYFPANLFSDYAEVSWDTFVESWPKLNRVVARGHWRDMGGEYQHFIDTAKRIRPDCTGFCSTPSD